MFGLSSLLIACSLACAAPWQAPEFPVGYWCGPPVARNDAAAWQRVADANFTVGGMSFGYDVAQNRQMLDLCQRAGLKALVLDARVHSRMVMSPRYEEILRQVVRDYADHPALLGYFLQDEPGAVLFGPLGQISQTLQRLDPTHLPYINLFPTYATPEQLQTPGYEAYLKQFLEVTQPGVLSYDHYCLQRNETDGQQYFENLGLIREHALRAGVPAWNIIQAMSYDRAMRQPDAEEMRWQVYTSLAYGMKGLLYFVYWSYNDVPEDVGIVDHLGEPGPLFDAVRQLNGEIRALGPTLLGLTSTGVYHTGEVPPGATRLGSAQLVSLPADAQLLVGFLQDAKGTPYALVANRSHEESAQFAIRFSPLVSSVEEVSRNGGVDEPRELAADHSLQQFLAPGDGVLLRLGLTFSVPEPVKVRDRIDFEFGTDGELEGWTQYNSLDDIRPAGGIVDMRFSGPDPFMLREWLDIEPDLYTAVRIRMKLPPGISEGQFFWTTEDEPSFTDTKYLGFPVQGDGEWHEYRIPVGEHERWRGQRIVGIRLDPAAAGSRVGDRVQVDWIRGE